MRKWINLISENTEAVPHGDPGVVVQIGELTFDQRRGIGEVPDLSSIDYKGFACLMTPSQFIVLAEFRDFHRESSIDYLTTAIQNGEPIASPFLDVVFNENDPMAIPKVRQHEGRTRCEAVRRLYGDIPMLVAVFPSHGLRARHLTLDHIRRFRETCIPQRQTIEIRGPHCGKIVWLQGGWKTL